MGVQFEPLADLGFANHTYEELFGGRLLVFADETLCGVFQIREPLLLVVGSEGQPEPCRAEGALLEFGDGHGRMMFATFPFAADTTVSFRNLAPWPPVTYPAYVCAAFDANGIESGSCRMVGPPGPSGSGNVGLVTRASLSRSLQAVLVVGVVLAVAGARYGVGRRAA